MKSITIILVIISILLTVLGSYFVIIKSNSPITKELIWRWSPYLISLAIFIELYYDFDGDSIEHTHEVSEHEQINFG